MKKFISVLLMLMIVISCFAGCTLDKIDMTENTDNLSDTLQKDVTENNGEAVTEDNGEAVTEDEPKYEKYQSIIADTVNGGVSIGPAEIRLGESSFYNEEYKENVSDATCQFGGKSYTGSYKRTEALSRLAAFDVDIYSTEDKIEFGLHEETGELVYINFMSPSFFDAEPYLPDVSNPDAFAEEIGTKMASEYIDLSEYDRYPTSMYTRSREKDGKTYEIKYYFIVFARKIGGYFSSDYISFKISSKGQVAAMVLGDIGVFDGVECDVEKDLVDRSIHAKIDSVLKAKYTAFKIKETSIDGQRIFIDSNGYICISNEVIVYFEHISPSDPEVPLYAGARIYTVVGRKNQKTE